MIQYYWRRLGCVTHTDVRFFMTWLGDCARCSFDAHINKAVVFFFFIFFFLALDKEITPWRSSAEERRHHTPLLSLRSCFYLYGEVCAKNSSKRSSGISAKRLGYITEQSIDTLGWTGPPLITSTHSFKYCRVLLRVESLYSAYLRHSASYFESFERDRSRVGKWWMPGQLVEVFQ